MAEKYNFAIADDHMIVRKGMASFFKSNFPFSDVTSIGNFLDILQLVSIKKIDILVLDVNFPEGTSLGLVPIIKEIQPGIKILIYSGYDEDVYAVRYFNAGANGYLSKLSDEEELKKAIYTLLLSGKYMSQNIQNKILDSVILKKAINPFEQLSNREIEIAKLMIEGFGNNTIAKSLNIGKSTVSTYKSRIFEKLLISSLSSLINLYNTYHSVVTI